MAEKETCDICPNRHICPKDKRLDAVREFISWVNSMNNNSTGKRRIENEQP